MESNSIVNISFGKETVSVEHENKEDKYYVTEDCDGQQRIFTKVSEKIYFTLNNISLGHVISVEVKFDRIDCPDILLCKQRCDPLFQIDDADESFLVTNPKYSKCEAMNVIDDCMTMKIPISFLCLTSHHRQGMFYKLIFSSTSTSNNQEKKELGCFLIKVCTVPKRDLEKFTNTPIKKRKLSRSEDGPCSEKNNDNNIGTYLVMPRNDAARKNIIDFVKSCEGTVQEYQLTDRIL